MLRMLYMKPRVARPELPRQLAATNIRAEAVSEIRFTSKSSLSGHLFRAGVLIDHN